MRTLIKILNLFILLIMTVWVTKDFGWDSGLGFLIFLATFLGQETLSSTKIKNSQDKLTCNRFLSSFASDSSMAEFFKEQDLHNPIHNESLDEIARFLRSWDNAEHEFLNKKLEKLRKNLLKNIKHFDIELSKIVNPNKNNLNIFSTKFDDVSIVDENILKEREAKVIELNKLATLIYSQHQDLTREIKKNLNS